MRIRFAIALTVAASLPAVPGCGAAGAPASNADNFGWVQHGDSYARPGEGGFNVRWSKQLTDRWEARYLPVELSSAEFDVERKRVFIGTSEGNMFAFELSGRRLFFYDAGAQIEAKPAVDPATGEVYFPSVDGTVHALTVSGERKWRTKLIGAVRTQPVITADALYVVAENDTITALARDDGRILWTYAKEPVEEITIAGHAGMLLEDGRLFAAFTDGAVAAINPADGRLFWEIETSLDVELRPGNVPQFLDVDTTPVLRRGTLYVASFTAGLYALDAVSGTVQWRDAAFTGVTGLAMAGRMLVISSARRGLSLMDLRTREVQWEKAPERGAPTAPIVTETGTVIYGETRGSLLALSLADGREIARAEGGAGFSATPTVLGGFGGALSNGGRFLFLRVN
ncbi:MAG: PQQ-binding-like beta-propeller repeat protein [Polyangiales bacterium]|jgi:outer membrane protein assembly factor BamB